MIMEFSIATLQKVRCRAKASITRRSATRLPGIVKTLVLAHQIEEAIAAGRARDYADVARQLGVTRTRMSQIMNLLLLSPAIQEQLLLADVPLIITERQLRPVVAESEWNRQEQIFASLLRPPVVRNASSAVVEPSH